MRNRLLLLCALLVSVRGVSGAEERLSFDRPSRVGDFLQVEINLTAQREYRFVFPGPDRPVEKQESLVTTLFADLKILEVDPEGNALRLEIRISSAGGFLNGRRFDSSLLRGKTILADLKTSPARFTDASTGKPVPPEAKALLAAVFRPPGWRYTEGDAGKFRAAPSGLQVEDLGETGSDGASGTRPCAESGFDLGGSTDHGTGEIPGI